MAGTTVTIDSSQFDSAIARVLAAANQLGPVLKNIGEYEASATRDRFQTETDPSGNRWRRLNDLYATTKRGSGILRGESRTLSEIVWQLAEGEAVEIGSNAIYARIHNQGGTIVPKSASALVFSMGGRTFKVKSVTIPQRQFLGFSSADMEEIAGIIEDHFAMAVSGGGSN